ncbi:MAG TPA: hypothetical protein VGM19_04760 [Armatimonadota bacterium]|jgi:hypothetical protein
MKRNLTLLCELLICVLLLVPLAATWAAETGTYNLGDYGEMATPAQAQATYEQAAAAIIKAGGGLLVIPPTAPQDWSLVNAFQQDREDPATVTVLDLRRGYENFLVPGIGARSPSGWAGQHLSRTINVREGETGLSSHGIYQIQEMRSNVVQGSSSYNQWTVAASLAGADQRVYLPTVRGAFVGQMLNIDQPFELFMVKSVGWDRDKNLPFITSDFQEAHAKGALVWNKHVTGIAYLENNTMANNQSMDLQVSRRQYAQGDCFLISASLFNQGDVFSGGGDEAACIYNAETIYDAQSFHSTVESRDPASDVVVFTAAGTESPQKLASCRGLINMNPKKWITAGTVKIVAPDDWAGMFTDPSVMDPDGRTVDLTRLAAYRGTKPAVTTWEGNPVKGLINTYRGKAYPSLIKDNKNLLGGRIIGSADCGWTPAVVGRFFAVADPGECLMPADPQAGYATTDPKRTVYRWYLIREFLENPDGTKAIRIERIRWAAVNAGSPLLFDRESYTWDNHERPLKYLIAPGAWVTNVGEGWVDRLYSLPTDPRRIKIAASPDAGTPFDFQPGDPLELAVGPDPANPTGLRVRFHNQMPTTLEDAGVAVMNYSRVAMTSALALSGAYSLEDAARQKDRQPSFLTGIELGCATRTGLSFSADVVDQAMLFKQPHNRPQPIRWATTAPGGDTTLQVRPDTGIMEIHGAGVSLQSAGLQQVSGLSATATPALNLRGIAVPVAAGARRVTITFPQPEADAVYSLVVQPSWMTLDSVTRKTKTGFVVEFSAAPPAGGTVDWQLLR